MPSTTRIDPRGVAPGLIVSRFGREETAALVEEWLAVYGRDADGVNAKAYLWHIFSAGRYPCVAREEARARYDAEDAVQFVVLSNDRREAFLTDRRPTACGWLDYCVFPRNLAWTMARTHEEEWLGPYFARHPDHRRLDAENAAALRKRREREAAKAKGWGG